MSGVTQQCLHATILNCPSAQQRGRQSLVPPALWGQHEGPGKVGWGHQSYRAGRGLKSAGLEEAPSGCEGSKLEGSQPDVTGLVQSDQEAGMWV